MGSPWLRWTREAPGDGLRLICLPHAGSGPAPFLRWAGRLGDVEVGAVCLPGRERRITESRIRAMDRLVDELAEAVEPISARPYALFGHSFGGWAAFELCRRLEAVGNGPERLVVSASRPPHLTRGPLRIRSLSDSAFLAHVRRIGGLPPEVLAHEDLISLVLPALRDDFTLAEDYSPGSTARVRAPLAVLGGTDDRTVAPADLRVWRDLAAGPFSLTLLPGGHFYLFDRESDFLQTLHDVLTSVPPGPGVRSSRTEEAAR